MTNIKRQTKSIYLFMQREIYSSENSSNVLKMSRHNCFNHTVPIFIVALWYNHNVSSFKAIMVAYNKVFKYLMNVKGVCSMSQLFIDNNVDHFKVLFRKCTLGVFNRLSNSKISL